MPNVDKKMIENNELSQLTAAVREESVTGVQRLVVEPSPIWNEKLPSQMHVDTLHVDTLQIAR
jgi:hypothetical protein